MRGRDRQQREALGKQLLGPLLSSLELAERGLDRNLEQGAGAEQRFGRIGDRLARGLRKARIVGEPPQSGVGVEEEPQSSTPSVRATSSGQTSKSSPRRMRPARAPGLRRAAPDLGNATSRATGWGPRRGFPLGSLGHLGGDYGGVRYGDER